MHYRPLVSAMLADIRSSRAGIGFAVNNAIARIAGLVSIVSIGIITGTTIPLVGFKAGGAVSAIGIKNPARDH